MSMTRETKVGVVVCLSFLCLVGVVLGTKLRGDLTDEDEVIDIPEPVVASAGTSPPAAAIPTQASNGNGPQVIPTIAVQDAQPLPMPPVIKKDRTDTIPPKSTGGLDIPPPPDQQETLTTSTPAAVAPISDVPRPTQDEKRDDAIYVPFLGYLPNSALVAAPEQTEEIMDIAELLGGQTDKSGTEGAVVPKDVPAPVVERPATDPTKDLLETTPLTTSGAPAADIRGGNPGQATPIPGPRDRTPPDSAKSTKTDDVKLTVAPPPPATSTTGPSAVLLTPKPPSEIPARLDTGSNGGAPTRASDTATGPGPVAQPIVQTSANENPRRIGAAPTVSTPAISVPTPGSTAPSRPAAPSTPRVDSWDEETYRAKAGDTFERISIAHFNTDKYADALRRFNVTHPQANDKMRADPATLDTGEAVYIPPAYILEKRYGVALIPGYKPPRESTPANDSPRTANSSPRNNSAVTTEAANYRLYRVSPSGQNMREIAKAALGNPEKWKDIYSLNPTLDPAYAVRGSAIIKVPAEANVPAANVPPPETR